MMKTTLFKAFTPLVIIALAMVLVMQGCKDDEATPTTAKFGGTITIENMDLWETWQDSGEVQVTIFPVFSLDPLAGWGEVPDNTLGPGVPGGTFAVGAPVNAQNPLVLPLQVGQTQYGYEFELTDISGPVTFSAIAVGFRHDFIQDPSRRSATLGVYWDNEDTVSHGIVIKPTIGAPPIFNFPPPATVTVNPGDDLELNFKADLGFVEDWYQ